MITINILHGFVASAFIPSESMILSDLDESRKGISYGMVSFIRGLGAMPTGIIGGYLMGSIHFTAPLILTTIGIIILILYLLRYGDRFDALENK